MDEGVAAIMGALRASGELDDTLVLFTADNGFFHGEHRVQNGKVLVYEPSIRVPLLMRGPGVPRGARRRQLVTNADLAPTILDAADARAGRVQDGRSLFPLLRDRGREWGRDLLIEGGDAGANAFDALRTYRYVFVQYTNGEQELYDLRRDPFQLQSRHADPRYSRTKAELARRLIALRSCRGRGCRARPGVRLRVARSRRGCLARVRGRGIETGGFPEPPPCPRPPRALPSAGVGTEPASPGHASAPGRVVTLDRRLPRACR